MKIKEKCACTSLAASCYIRAAASSQWWREMIERRLLCHRLLARLTFHSTSEESIFEFYAWEVVNAIFDSSEGAEANIGMSDFFTFSSLTVCRSKGLLLGLQCFSRFLTRAFKLKHSIARCYLSQYSARYKHSMEAFSRRTSVHIFLEVPCRTRECFC